MARTLTREEARRFYDWFGSRQDLQAVYEDRAVADLVLHGRFDRARAVLEFGCGTGRLAERLLAGSLPRDGRYLGIDISSTMVGLARRRLEPWRERAEVRLSDGSPRLPVEAGSVDRVLATYVLDLLADEDIGAFLGDAHRALAPEGLLCTVCLTRGRGPLARLVSSGWERLHALSPRLLGGCRPIRVRDRLSPADWTVEHERVVTALGVSSEVLVARRAAPLASPGRRLP